MYVIIGTDVYVHGKQIPYATDVHVSDLDLPSVIPENGNLQYMATRGFYVTTENGFVVSTMWGTYTYSANYGNTTRELFLDECPDAEMAVWPYDKQAGMLPWLDGDTVCGFVPSAAWHDVVLMVSRLPTNTSIIPIAVHKP